MTRPSTSVYRQGHSNLLIAAIAAAGIIALTLTLVVGDKEIRDSHSSVHRLNTITSQLRDQQAANAAVEAAREADQQCTERWAAAVTKYTLKVRSFRVAKVRLDKRLADAIAHGRSIGNIRRIAAADSRIDAGYLHYVAAHHYPQFTCADTPPIPVPKINTPSTSPSKPRAGSNPSPTPSASVSTVSVAVPGPVVYRFRTRTRTVTATATVTCTPSGKKCQ